MIITSLIFFFSQKKKLRKKWKKEEKIFNKLFAVSNFIFEIFFLFFKNKKRN